jgi:LPS-assembly protein
MSGTEPVVLTADELQLNQETGNYIAIGHVRLKKSRYTLFSDRMEWNPETEIARAFGAVKLVDDEGNYFAGKQLELNTASGQGTMQAGKGFWQEENFHFRAAQIDKLDENSYRAEEAEFTACDAEVPAWKFKAKDLKVTRGGYARAKHTLFYVKDIPIFYLPYFSYPLEDRKTGLLMPTYGHSSKKGLQISQPFYWAISRNTDATFYLDYLSKMGLGKGIDYRYIWTERDAGEFSFYHINGWDEGEDRFAVSWDHRGVLPGEVKLMADIEYVNDDDYFSDFGQEAEAYNKSTTTSTIYAQKNWQKLNLAGQMKYIRDLDDDNDYTLQRLPELRLSLIRKKFRDTPVFYGFDTTATHFWRAEGNNGKRAALRPYLATVLKPVRFLDLDAEVGLLERLYSTSDGEENEELFDFTLGASTRLHRVFAWDGDKVDKIRHSLEPEIRYSYTPSTDQDHLPDFDRFDDIEPENKLSLALANRLTARLEDVAGNPDYHEFLYLRLAQEFDIHESRRDRDPGDELSRPSSPLRAELIVRPTTWSHIDLDATYDMDPESESLLVFRSRGGINDGKGNALSFDYTYLEDVAKYLSGSIKLGVFDPLSLSYAYRYDFTDNRSLESLVGLEYRFQCWSVLLTYRDRLEDQEFLMTFVLKGIGEVFRF